MVKISVLHRHGTYEEFEGDEFNMPPSEHVLIIYDEKGRVSNVIPFDSVASIDFNYEEETKPIRDICSNICYAVNP